MFSKTGILAAVLCFFAICQWRGFANAKSNQCVDKFEVFRNHTMCIADPSQDLDQPEQSEIEIEINNVRKSVNPAAKQMMEVGYSLALEKAAQTWADTCNLRHDDPYNRFMPGRYSVGQNIFIGANLSWSAVIDMWAKENSSFHYNQTGNDRAKAGNITQMVYEDTVLVGCGKHQCGSLSFYVCNFAPRIPDAKLDTPYVSGNSTVGCHGHFANSTYSLCRCIGKFCTNGGTLDMTTCDCQCVPGVQTYDSHICELTCTENGDHKDCPTMSESDCKTDGMAPFKCPWMCKICPYGGKHYRQNSVRMPWETTTTPSTTTVKCQTAGPTTATTNDPNAASPQKGSASSIHLSSLLAACLYLANVVFLSMLCVCEANVSLK